MLNAKSKCLKRVSCGLSMQQKCCYIQIISFQLVCKFAPQFGTPTQTLYVTDSGNWRVRKVFLPSLNKGEGSSESPCPEGTFSDSEGGATVEDCLPCPAGLQ